MIAQLVQMELERARQDATLPAEIRDSYAGVWADLPENDELEALDGMRHKATPPIPLMDERLR